MYLHRPKQAGVIFKYHYPPTHFYDGCAGERITNIGGDMDYNKTVLDNGKGREHQLYHPSRSQSVVLHSTT